MPKKSRARELAEQSKKVRIKAEQVKEKWIGSDET